MPTAAELAGQYIKLRDWIKREQVEFDARLRPYKEGMAAIEGAAQQLLNEQDGQSIKTDQGTIYRTTVMYPRIADAGLFHAFIAEKIRYAESDEQVQEAFAFFTAAVAKPAVQEYMETNGKSPPPGVDVTFAHNTNFRKPGEK